MAIDLKALAMFDTPTICNTIELFDVRPRTAGYMDGRIRACFPEMPPAVGYAATIPLEIAGEIAGAATEYTAAESILLDYLKSPGPAPTAFADARQAMMDAIGALGNRVRSRSRG